MKIAVSLSMIKSFSRGKNGLTSRSGTSAMSSLDKESHFCIRGGIKTWRCSSLLKAGPTESASVPMAS